MSAVQIARSPKKTVMKKIADLAPMVFVREKLDQDYAVTLGLLYSAGEEVKPIIITKSNVIVEGRHRIEGRLLAGFDDIECEVIDDMPRKDLIREAINANLGGS